MIYNKLFESVLREQGKPQSFKESLKSNIFKKVLREAGKAKDDQSFDCDDIMGVLADMRINDLIEKLRKKLSSKALPPELSQIIEKYEDRIAFVDIDIDDENSLTTVAFAFNT